LQLGTSFTFASSPSLLLRRRQPVLPNHGAFHQLAYRCSLAATTLGGVDNAVRRYRTFVRGGNAAGGDHRRQ